jgi:hypothetical protein
VVALITVWIAVQLSEEWNPGWTVFKAGLIELLIGGNRTTQPSVLFIKKESDLLVIV